jgi:hypothetical protein
LTLEEGRVPPRLAWFGISYRVIHSQCICGYTRRFPSKSQLARPEEPCDRFLSQLPRSAPHAELGMVLLGIHMSTENNDEFEIISDYDLSLCLVNQCCGCEECQHPQVLQASLCIRVIDLKIEELEKKLADRKKELEHFTLFRKLLCHHFWMIPADRETCNHCCSERSKKVVSNGRH